MDRQKNELRCINNQKPSAVTTSVNDYVERSAISLSSISFFHMVSIKLLQGKKALIWVWILFIYTGSVVFLEWKQTARFWIGLHWPLHVSEGNSEIYKSTAPNNLVHDKIISQIVTDFNSSLHHHSRLHIHHLPKPHRLAGNETNNFMENEIKQETSLSFTSSPGVNSNKSNISNEINADPTLDSHKTSFQRKKANTGPEQQLIANNNGLELSDPTTKVQRQGILDLLPWELQSIHEYDNLTNSNEIKIIGQCQAPQGIHDSCCPGSFSIGGSVTRSWAHHCFKGAEIYDRVTQAVRQVLQRTATIVDDEECDLCRIVEIIYQRNLRFAVTGDSMMSQNVDGFYCELLRRGYNVTRSNTELIDRHGMVGMKEIWTHEISGPEHWQHPIQMQFLFQYRPNATNNMKEMQDIAASYDVLVMNFGLHWPYWDKAGYKDTMEKIFNIARQGNITLLAHRETSAQHHNYTGGEWATTRTACVPLNHQNDSEIIGWREEVVQSKAKELGYKVVIADETLGDSKVEDNELVVLPFFNLTASMHYLHPDECTHYCSTPYLWMPIWRSLRLAMDRRWAHQ